jgi:hypothetical protein
MDYNQMRGARHIALTVVLMLMVAFAAFGVYRYGYKAGMRNAECGMQADTIVVERIDTVTLVGPSDTLTRIVWKPYPVAVHDTVKILRHTTDSIYITLPYQHRHLSKPDTLDIWYSGVDPRIDSVNLYYHHTTKIIKQPYEVAKMPSLTLDLGAGAMWHEQAVKPFAVGKLNLNRPHTTFTAFGAVNPDGDWAAGLTVTYRMNLIK